MTLQPRYPDSKFLDVVTLEVKCTFNQCIEKFEPCDYVEKSVVQRGRPVNTKKRHYYACKECGRKVEGDEPS
jgi:hypothetical protein